MIDQRAQMQGEVAVYFSTKIAKDRRRTAVAASQAVRVRGGCAETMREIRI
jgi:hypothetical protein